MRLLKTTLDGGVSFTKDLSEEQLSGPEYKYAILSHRWGKQEEEVTYEDVLNGLGTSKPGIGSQKIRFCIQQARQDNLKYFWIDTCCIDKSKDAELSQALRSMFRWYARSEKCYVYLSDVPQQEQSEELGTGWEQDFRHSEWFRRGWTLQELIAPSALEFYSRHGKSLGTRVSLEKQINEVTRIPVRALRGYALTEFSVHERRQWQEGRRTQQPEDMVYSMFGLLNVSMPVLYGEGLTKAQQRLENEINITQKGIGYRDFSLTFSLADAAVETQHFVARTDELEEIRTNLVSDGSRKVVVLHGLGGMGKTQLAIAYAKRHKDDYSALLWLNAKDENAVKSSFMKMARQIVREQPSSAARLAGLRLDEDVDDVVDAVRAWLSRPMNTRWLMICDNYDNPKVSGNTDPSALDLRSFLPEAYQGAVIVTTRSAEVRLGHCIRIQKLAHLQDSLQILENSSQRSNLVHDGGAVELAQKLDGLPLALATAGAYLSQSAITFSKYLDLYTRSWAKLQQKSRSLITYEDRTLYTTWQVSYDQIERSLMNWTLSTSQVDKKGA
ncbi:hypothetical protein AMS68_006236 [Peltaster fructicola]|uniref:Heterokaryon incompatibility domain-containing protein n=1 Tax=Peltaster fructicola TaxID=286661 RepID=A0A6H0Y1I0_9PEZI|nr:hypothetical protein AMS68_006236 [Peltaster fructicola]